MTTKTFRIILILNIIVFYFLAVPSSQAKILNMDQSPTSSSSINPFRLLGHIGGEVNGIFIQGKYAYLGIGTELVIFDITNPYYPNRLGSVVLPSLVHNMEYRYPFLFVADYNAGLQIINISNSASPSIVGSSPGPSYSMSVALNGDYAFLGSGSGQLRIYNISNPTAPVQILTLSIQSVDLEVLGSYLYVTGEGLYILDITNPAAPVTLSHLSISAYKVALSYPYAYITGIVNTQRVNISDPKNPFADGTNMLGNRNATIKGDYIYTISDNCSIDPCTSTLNIIYISTSIPALLGSTSFKGNTSDLSIYGNFVIATNGMYGGYRVFNASNPGNPHEIYYYNSPGTLTDFELIGNYAYILDKDCGLRIVSIQNPGSLTAVGYKDILSNSQDIAVVGNYAYITTDYWDLRVININNPTSPSEVGSDILLNTPYGISAGSNVVYIGDTQSFIVESVVDPTHPYKIGYTPIPTYAAIKSIAIRGNYAFLPYYDGFSVVNISNPIAPVKVATLQEGYMGGDDIALGQNYAYIPRSYSIQIINITNPANPTHVDYFYPSQNVNGIAVENNLAYMVTDNSLILADLSNPLSPVEIGSYYLGESGTKVVVKNGLIYVADGHGGFFILQIVYSMISGRVESANGLPFSEVAISAGVNRNTFSDVNGSYNFSNLIPSTYTITPHKTGFWFLPSSRVVTTPPTSNEQNFTILPESETISVTPGITTTLSYSDTQGLSTTIIIPANAVTETLTVKITPNILNKQINGFAFTGHAFNLEVFRGPNLLPNYKFFTPVKVSIDYSNYDVRIIYDENRLTLWWLNGLSWENGNQTCDLPYTEFRDLALNNFGVSICETGQFGLFGPTHLINLPIISR